MTAGSFDQILIWLRGAGEMASGAAYSLHSTGFKVVMSDLAKPTAIRREVAFCEAMFGGSANVEGTTATLCDLESSNDVFASKSIPLIVDAPNLIETLQPHVVVDGRMLKHDNGEPRPNAKFVIGMGPGFTVGDNCDAVIETMRGHNLGRILWEGSSHPYTGTPGSIGGETLQRVMYAPIDGMVNWEVEIGDLVKQGDQLGSIDGTVKLNASLTGRVRGLISPEVSLKKGLKIADIDPRGLDVDHREISDKARTIGRGVLEAVIIHLRNLVAPQGQ